MQPPDFPPPTIAVVEDDADMRASVCSFLRQRGMQAWGAESAEDFYVHLLRRQADLAVVNLGLPGESGLSLVRRLAQRGMPAVVLTARGDVQSRIAGLEAGALQYFVKPADLGELAAGIRSQLRRTRIGAAHAAMPWHLDASQRPRLVAPNGRAVELTTRELELLGSLMAAQGALVSKQALMQVLGASNAKNGFHRIESSLTRLRRKTLEGTGLPLPVRAVFGKGLVFIQ